MSQHKCPRCESDCFCLSQACTHLCPAPPPSFLDGEQQKIFEGESATLVMEIDEKGLARLERVADEISTIGIDTDRLEQIVLRFERLAYRLLEEYDRRVRDAAERKERQRLQDEKS